MTKNNNKKISRNLLTNIQRCAIIQIQTKERGNTTMHAYTALIIFGLVAPIVFIAIPLLVENIMLKKEG